MRNKQVSKIKHEFVLSAWEAAMIVVGDRPVVVRKMPNTSPGDGVDHTRLSVEVDPAHQGVTVRRGAPAEPEVKNS